MNFFYYLILFIFSTLLFSEEKAYEPWYTGPLFATNGDNIGKGNVNIQPYFFYEVKQSDPKTYSIINLLISQVGISNSLDMIALANCNYRENDKSSSFKYGDTFVGMGLQVLKQKEFTLRPSIKVLIGEYFPTGKYKNLDPDKLRIDSSGDGCFATELALIYSKVFYWFINHPINLRMNLFYTYNHIAKVKNFNTYGGGYNTDGKVKPGNIITSIFSFEYSFTQRWVFAMDTLYVYTSKASFKGKLGTDIYGEVAQNDLPFNYSLSLAPAIEYNFSSKIGIIGGVYFPVITKNITKWTSGVISFNYTF